MRDFATTVRTIRRVARHGRSTWPRVAALFFVAVLATPLALLQPIPLKLAVDSVLGSQPLPAFLDAVVPDGVTRSAAALLLVVAALTVSIVLLSQVQSLVQKYLVTSTGEQLVLLFRAALFRHMQRLSPSYRDWTASADSLRRMHTDAPAIRNILVDGLVPAMSSGATLAALVYVMVKLDWQLALIALAVSPPLVVATRFYSRRLRRQWRNVKKLERTAMSLVREVLGPLRVVKAFGTEERETERFVSSADEGARGRIRLALAEGRFSAIRGMITAAGAAAILFLGFHHVRAGILSLGDLLLLMAYAGKLYEPIRTIGQKLAELPGWLGSAERAFAILDLRPALPERADARPLTRARGSISFRGVSFTDHSRAPILQGISFEIAPGARLGIAGAKGAGKSALIGLLTRLFDPTQGRILLDGVDLRDYRLEDLSRQFSVVLREPVMLSASIADNIAYPVAGASRDGIVAAARAANAHDFIERLPRGYDTHVGEGGVKLSGMQRQQIALARAFLKDGPLLILDEPTSAVDHQAEPEILEALERLKRGRTVIAVSRRMSTLAGCSEVLLIEQGRVLADTTRIFAPERSQLPAPAGSIEDSRLRRRELLAHPVVQAWRRLGSHQPLPTLLTPARFRRDARKTSVYRLDGVAPDGGAVIAKRCKQVEGAVERAVYEEYLPRLPIPAASYLGCVEDPSEEFTWLFTREVSGERYAHADPVHHVYAARWIGTLHARAQAIGRHPAIPTADPRRYLEHLRHARERIHTSCRNPILTAENVAFMEMILSRLDEIEQGWDRLETLCAAMPQTLVHGDFNGKNLLVRSADAQPGIVVFDWEDAGWGPPAVDLAQITLPASRLSASPDLAVYWDVARDFWPEHDRADVERFAYCGTVFRTLAVLDWESGHLAYEWAGMFLGSFRLYETELTQALHRLDFDAGRGSRARREVAHS